MARYIQAVPSFIYCVEVLLKTGERKIFGPYSTIGAARGQASTLAKGYYVDRVVISVGAVRWAELDDRD